MSELLVGLIGAGGMGKALSKGLAACDLGRLAAVADVAEGAAQAAIEELGGGMDAYTDPAELLVREDIGAVLVAVPNWLHPPTVIQAAAAGKHVFCEKPMALNVADARTMIEACGQAGVKLMIGQVARYNQPFAWIIEKTREGMFGEPCAMQVTRVGGPWGGRYAQSWRLQKEKTGGPLFEVAAHEIDFIRQVMGRATSVYATAANFVNPKVNYEDYASLLIGFEGGRKASLLSGHCGFQTGYDGKLYGTEGTLFFDRTSGAVTYTLKGETTVHTTASELAPGSEPGVQREVREFVEAVVNDTEVTIPGSEGLANTEIAQAAGISAEEGRVVDLPLP